MRDDAQSLDGVAVSLECLSGFVQEIDCFGDLNLVAPALKIDEGSDGADLRLGRLR